MGLSRMFGLAGFVAPINCKVSTKFATSARFFVPARFKTPAKFTEKNSYLSIACIFCSIFPVMLLAFSAIFLAMFLNMGIVHAAPLFPDVPENFWAKDAVSNLSARGILEGYPDGTFKGDRATTRWEMAMAIQRLLAKMDSEHIKFARKEDLEALRSLTNEFRDELNALGVRVGNIEDKIKTMETRVTELERITFEGDIVTRFVGIGIANRGTTLTDWNTDVGGIAALDPTRKHNLSTIDLFSFLPLVNGTSYTSRMRLCLKVKFSNDFKSFVRFASYTSLGNQYIDAYWGVPSPYLSSPFTGNGGGSPQNINNTPWTRLTLDQFWLEHNPTGTKLIIGAIENTTMDATILRNAPKPGYRVVERSFFREGENLPSPMKQKANPDIDLPFYGIQALLQNKNSPNWSGEIICSKLSDDPYQNGFWSAKANNVVTPWQFSANFVYNIGDRGKIQLNHLEAWENYNNGQGINVIPNRGNFWRWADPFEYASTPANGRPMRSTAISPGFISRQSQSSSGISAEYLFKPSRIKLSAAYFWSSYKPNTSSRFSANDNHYRIQAGWTDKSNNLSLDLRYMSTGPSYDPFQLYYPPVGDMLLGGLPNGLSVVPIYISFGYQLHDNRTYENNRQGFVFNGNYVFSKGNGRASVVASYLQQVKPSVPIRNISGLYGGREPGFIDTIFNELATNETATAVPESPIGKRLHIGGKIEYKFTPSNISATLDYNNRRWIRDTSFPSNTPIAKKNATNLLYETLEIGLKKDFADKFTLRAGYDWSRVLGYFFRANYMDARGGDTVMNYVQHIPYIGFDYKIGKNVEWNFDARFYNTDDKLDPKFAPRSKESWDGQLFMTQFKVKF